MTGIIDAIREMHKLERAMESGEIEVDGLLYSYKIRELKTPKQNKESVKP